LSQTITSGQPLFAEPTLHALETATGAESAWRAAVAAHGAQSPELARGHYAVALETDGVQMLAVDRFATRTLCYRRQGERLEWAERADAWSGAEPALDPQALFEYVYFHVIPAPRTVFAGVHRLPAAHAARQADGRTEVRRYWTPSFTEQAPASFEAARDRFRALLADAVRAQLRGGTPACFLSGGTDSSTVAGMLAEVSGRKPATYSIGFEAEGYDEMHYARIAARHFGTDHHEYYVTPADLVEGIPKMAAHLDQPFGNSSALPAYCCALQAGKDAVTHLLAGDGGDELFGGNTRYAKQRVFGWYEDVPAPLRKGLLEPLTDSGALDRIPLAKKAASYVRQARVPLPGRMQTYNLLHRLGIDNVFTPAFRARIDVGAPDRFQAEVWDEVDAGASRVNKMLAFDWRFTLAENDLPKVRQSVELAGLTVGYPFLDSALVDFSSALPTHYKLRGMKLRWFFKEALRGFLPDEIITKKKHGFGLPFGVWAVRDAPLAALARDSLLGLGERGIVQPGFVRAVLEQHLPQHPGYYGEVVWILMMLEQWLRQHAPDWRFEG
jgi:asparagine synthase (glutamine-hydrolysing)